MMISSLIPRVEEAITLHIRHRLLATKVARPACGMILRASHYCRARQRRYMRRLADVTPRFFQPFHGHARQRPAAAPRRRAIHAEMPACRPLDGQPHAAARALVRRRWPTLIAIKTRRAWRQYRTPRAIASRARCLAAVAAKAVILMPLHIVAAIDRAQMMAANVPHRLKASSVSCRLMIL